MQLLLLLLLLLTLLLLLSVVLGWHLQPPAAHLQMVQLCELQQQEPALGAARKQVLDSSLALSQLLAIVPAW
jgi:hypothetical protein